ncbi:response regulator [Lawsonibacter sp. OA9]|uniref:response regulator transcription factor n=1 Tax=Oscillospiraceae TaxID=216572 RepID=UPI001F06541E|nr:MULTISPECIES: response regulator [Oscillospiraceae]MCH1978266.1 response regulator [Lawsonibacter sp. OA9]MCH1982225.1 response regulator [Ruminococcus sp. OA3]
MIRVFIVDDEDVILSGIRNAIQNLPGRKYQVCGEASDGETAWPMILESRPDVVLADVCMPFMNGLELAKIVKKTMPETKFIIISGHDEFEYAQEAVAIKVDAYVLKPINSRKLMDILETIEKPELGEQENPERLLARYSDESLITDSAKGPDDMISGHDLANFTSRLRYAKEEDLDDIYEAYYQSANDNSAESILFRYYLLMNLIMAVDELLKQLDENCDHMSAVSLLSVANSWEKTREVSKRYMHLYITQRDAGKNAGNSREIAKAKQYIEEHFDDSTISLNKVAKIAGFSPSYFSSLFTQEIGMSFVEYLTNYRMEKSKALIGDGHVRLQDLAEQVGYSDPYYFSQVFKKYFKISPKEYQNRKNDK